MVDLGRFCLFLCLHYLFKIFRLSTEVFLLFSGEKVIIKKKHLMKKIIFSVSVTVLIPPLLMKIKKLVEVSLNILNENYQSFNKTQSHQRTNNLIQHNLHILCPWLPVSLQVCLEVR